MSVIYILLISIISSSYSCPDLTFNDVVGTYTKTLGAVDRHYFKYTLNLDSDGTFNFHYYEDFTNAPKINLGVAPRTKNNYGRGTWELDGKIVTLTTDESSVNDEFILDFGGSKARFDFKSPRDKSDRIIPTSLRFFESELSWMVGITMEK